MREEPDEPPHEYDDDQYVYCPRCDRLVNWTQRVGDACTICIEEKEKEQEDRIKYSGERR